MSFLQKYIPLFYNNLYWWAKVRKYEKLGPDYVYNIKIDDFEYKLSFGNQPIGPAIVQRIEGRREPETMAIYRTLVKPGSKVLELGACYGEFTVLIDKLVGRDGRLVSVEGTPNTFSILENNVKINKLTNTEIHQLFITNSNNSVIFGLDDTHPYDAINKLKEKDNNILSDFIDQKKSTITHFLDQIKFFPDIIVMDIEGFEVDVFEDLFLNDNNTKYRPEILFEIHEDFYSKGLDYIREILTDAGYHIVKISGNMLCYNK